MNLRIISYFLGWVLKIEAAALLISGIVSVCSQDSYWFILFICAAVVFLIGTLMSPKKFKTGSLYSREGYTATALGWLLLALVGAVPFVITGKIPNYIDAVFEIASGFTTTGASILDEVEHLEKGLLFFRSFSHWIGGMGILVLILAILPFGGSGNHMQLMKAESPGPTVSKLVPRVRETAFVLYAIYFVMTIVMVITYMLAGMKAFDAFCIGFGTAGTGGFTVRNDGWESYSHAAVWLSTVWMFLFGTNFNVFYLLINRKFKSALGSEELRAYFLVVLFAIVFTTVTVFIGNPIPATSTVGKHLADTVRENSFTVVSTISSTGFTLPILEKWGTAGRTMLLFLMFVGCCGGSTGGGIKISRVLVLVKNARKELHMLIHPNAVRLVKLEGKTLEHNTVRSVTNYLILFGMIFIISLLIISVDPAIDSFTKGFASVLTCFNNIGPGLAEKVHGSVPLQTTIR